MSDPAPPDASGPRPRASLEAYKPYLALFGIATAAVAVLVVVGGLALAVFMRAGWVLVPLACAIWTLLPLRDLWEAEAEAGPLGSSGGPEAESLEGEVRRRVAGDAVRRRAVHALLITFTAWAALILLHLI